MMEREDRLVNKEVEFVKCMFCGGRVYVKLGLSAQYVFIHKPATHCPVKNMASFPSMTKAEHYWQQRVKEKRECRECAQKDKLLRAIKRKRNILEASLKGIRKKMVHRPTTYDGFKALWSEVKDIWIEAFSELEKLDE